MIHEINKTPDIVWQSLYMFGCNNVSLDIYDKLHQDIEREINILVWPAVHIFLRGDVE